MVCYGVWIVLVEKATICCQKEGKNATTSSMIWNVNRVIWYKCLYRALQSPRVQLSNEPRANQNKDAFFQSKIHAKRPWHERAEKRSLSKNNIGFCALRGRFKFISKKQLTIEYKQWTDSKKWKSNWTRLILIELGKMACLNRRDQRQVISVEECLWTNKFSVFCKYVANRTLRRKSPEMPKLQWYKIEHRW